MPIQLLKVSDQSSDFHQKVIERAQKIDSGEYNAPSSFKDRSLGMIFFEPSSRTNWSFHKAAQDMGLKIMSTYIDSSTSLSKGETEKDSLELFLNLNFDVVVMRSKANAELAQTITSQKDNLNFINAGFGSLAHPTQAILDAYTWMSHTENSSKILILGDLKHSRVVRSHLRLAHLLGYEVGLCPLENLGLEAPELEELRPSEVFKSREEALSWADVVMPLRAQKERFTSTSKETYIAQPLRRSELLDKHWLMHPGPIVWGEDMDYELAQYSKSLISHQQRSGVTCRAALISIIMEEM